MKKIDELKMEVVTLHDGQSGQYLDLRGLSIETNKYAAIQDICLSNGSPLITTAYGVAPNPALQCKSLWLRRDVGNLTLKWRIHTGPSGQVLIPEIVKATGL